MTTRWLTIRTPFFSFRVERRVPVVAGIILLLGLGILILSVSYGEYHIRPLDVTRALVGLPTDDPNHALVVRTFRLPRILVAFLAGAALATSGAIIQGLTRNPLAEPGVLGITSGASAAAVGIIVAFENVPLHWLPGATFTGGLLVALLSYGLAWTGTSSPLRLVLIGIGLGSLANGFVTILLVYGDIREVAQAYFWLAGSVYGRNWQHVQMIALAIALFLPLAWVSARQLNTLALGDHMAVGLGVNVEQQRALLLLISVALASAAVAVAGAVGFVGLVAPHMVRRLVGAAHEAIIPIAAVAGGLMMMLADLIGRWVISPSELPVGIVTAIIGAPYFLFLLYRTR